CRLFRESRTRCGVVFAYVGHVAFCVPLGLLLVVVFFGVRRPVWRAVWIAALLSLGIEICQYVFSVGRTSVDDWWCNTLGAFLGASFAVRLGRRGNKGRGGVGRAHGGGSGESGGLGVGGGVPRKCVGGGVRQSQRPERG